MLRSPRALLVDAGVAMLHPEIQWCNSRATMHYSTKRIESWTEMCGMKWG